MSLFGQYWEEERRRRELILARQEEQRKRQLARREREKELERKEREAEPDGFLRRVQNLLTPPKLKRVRFDGGNGRLVHNTPAHRKVIRACADLHAVYRAREQGLAPLWTLNRFEREAFKRLMKSLIESTPLDLRWEEEKRMRTREREE